MTDKLLLTQEEEAISFKDVRYRDNQEFIAMLQAADCSAIAQLAKARKHYEAKIELAWTQERERIIEWGNELCEGKEHWGTIYDPPKPKRMCSDCWQALKGEK